MTDPVSSETAGGRAPVADTPAVPVAIAPVRAGADAARDFKRLWLQVAVILLGAAAFGSLLVYLIGRRHVATSTTLMVLLGSVSLASGCWGAFRRWRDFAAPLSQLTRLLPQVRANAIPIEELSQIKGGLEPAIPLIQDLLRDLRRERVQNAILQEEIRQRVISRTESLERTIGSLKAQATRDVLTGLSNRRALETQLPALFKQCKLSGSDLVVLMIDVDYFKTLNDTLGHAAGDELLRQIGQLIRSSIRQNDFAFRCGGDEFVIVLPGATPPVGRNLAERLRSLVDALAKTLHVSRPPRLSIGLASMNLVNAASEAELLAEADKDLYTIKATRGSSRAA
jgi:diguanylate cyclase (GGDEF)-like protein